MQIVIDILPEEYDAICKVASVVNVIPFRIARSIKDGTVLPENHGRLIDADAITKNLDTLEKAFVINKDYLTDRIIGVECLAPIILEASESYKFSIIEGTEGKE